MTLALAIARASLKIRAQFREIRVKYGRRGARARYACVKQKNKTKKNARELTHFFKIVGSSRAVAAFLIIFRAVFRHWAVSAAGASCLQGRFAPLLVMESGLPDGARGIRVRTAWFDSTTPEVPGGRVPLRTVRTVELGGRSAQRGAFPLLRLRRATSVVPLRRAPV